MKISRSRIYKILNGGNQSVKNKPTIHNTNSDINERSRRRRKMKNLRYKTLKRGGARVVVDTNDKMADEIINEYIDSINQYVDELMSPAGEPILTGTATEQQINDIMDRTINKGIKKIVTETSKSKKNILQKLTENVFSLFIPASTTMTTFEAQLKDIVDREKIIISIHNTLNPSNTIVNNPLGKNFSDLFKQHIKDDIAMKRFNKFGCGAGMDATFEIIILTQESYLDEAFTTVMDKITDIKLRPSDEEFAEFKNVLDTAVYRINTLEKVISLYVSPGGLIDIQNKEIYNLEDESKKENVMAFYKNQTDILNRVTKTIQEKSKALSFNSHGVSILKNEKTYMVEDSFPVTLYSINDEEFEKHKNNSKEVSITAGGAPAPREPSGTVEMVDTTENSGSSNASTATTTSATGRGNSNSPNASAEAAPTDPSGNLEMVSPTTPATASTATPAAASTTTSTTTSAAVPRNSDSSGISQYETAGASEDGSNSTVSSDDSAMTASIESDDTDRSSGSSSATNTSIPGSSIASTNTLGGLTDPENSADATPAATPAATPVATPAATPVTENPPQGPSAKPANTSNTIDIDSVMNSGSDMNNNYNAQDPNASGTNAPPIQQRPQKPLEPPPVPTQWSQNGSVPNASDVSTKSTTTQRDNGDVEVNIKVVIPKNANFSINGNAGVNVETGLNSLTTNINKS